MRSTMFRSSSNDVTKAKIISGATMSTNGSYITLDLYSAGTAKLNCDALSDAELHEQFYDCPRRR